MRWFQFIGIIGVSIASVSVGWPLQAPIPGRQGETVKLKQQGVYEEIAVVPRLKPERHAGGALKSAGIPYHLNTLRVSVISTRVADRPQAIKVLKSDANAHGYRLTIIERPRREEWPSFRLTLTSPPPPS